MFSNNKSSPHIFCMIGGIFGLLLMLSFIANNVSAQQNSSDNSTNAFDIIQPNINAKSMFDKKQ
ncbi:MAG TPA: hypothetical protein VFV86_04990 [Nitrososphaeraceae archaeon]|nr:hypothetical protein [Nitrososphaeraceae archaeon]